MSLGAPTTIWARPTTGLNLVGEKANEVTRQFNRITNLKGGRYPRFYPANQIGNTKPPTWGLCKRTAGSLNLCKSKLLGSKVFATVHIP